MAKHVLRDAFLSINGVTLSDHVVSLDPSWEVDIHDKSSMGDLGHAKLTGLEDAKFTVELMQDYAAASVDATLSPLMRAAAFPFEIRPTTAVVSATNPKFTGNALLKSYPFVSGEIGNPHKISVEFEVDGVVTRATA